MGNRNAVGKKGNGKLGNLAIVFVHGSFCPVPIILYCVHLSLYTVPTLELNMPKFTAGSQSSPFPYTSLLWRTSIVAASAASSASIYNVIQTEGFFCPRRVSNRRKSERNFTEFGNFRGALRKRG